MDINAQIDAIKSKLEDLRTAETTLNNKHDAATQAATDAAAAAAAKDAADSAYSVAREAHNALVSEIEADIEALRTS